MNLIREN
jgi:hypothetical protein